MYHNSSQRKYWTFSKETNLDSLRLEANQKFRAKALSVRKVRVWRKPAEHRVQHVFDAHGREACLLIV